MTDSLFPDPLETPSQVKPTDLVVPDTKATTDVANPPPESHKQELEDIIASIRLQKKQYWPFKERPEIKGLSTLYYYDAETIDDFLEAIETYTAKKIQAELQSIADKAYDDMHQTYDYNRLAEALFDRLKAQQDTSKGELDG